MPTGANIERHALLDSTNRYAAEAVRRGAPDGLVVVADEQTAGRGRRDRRFLAPPGAALLCSFVCRLDLPLDQLHLVPSALGLAARDAIAASAGLAADLKWPNDVVIGEAKVAGLLAEVVTDGVGSAAVVAGIGINVAWPPGWPAPGSEEEALLTGATTLSAAAGRPISVDEVLAALVDAFTTRRDPLSTTAGRGELAAAYRAALATIGHLVRVELEGRALNGRVRDVDDAGRLVLEQDGGLVHIEVGDVVHLREAGEG